MVSRQDLNMKIFWSPRDRQYVAIPDGARGELERLSWLSRTPEGAARGLTKVIREALALDVTVGTRNTAKTVKVKTRSEP